MQLIRSFLLGESLFNAGVQRGKFKAVGFSVTRYTSVALIILTTLSSIQAEVITWTNEMGGYWSTPANWSPNRVPSAEDSVEITASGTYTVTLEQNEYAEVRSFIIGGAVGTQTLSNRTSLFIAEESLVGTNAVLSHDGWISGGVLTVNGIFNWISGYISDETLNISQTGVLNAHAADFYMGTCTVNNAGLINWAGLSLYADGECVINNLNTAIFDVQADSALLYGFPSGTFNNDGVFRRSGGQGLLAWGMFFQNSGLLDVQSGTIDFWYFYTHLPGSRLNFGISGPEDFGRISLYPVALFGGAISVNLLEAYTPHTNDTFAVMSFNQSWDWSEGRFSDLGGLLVSSNVHFQPIYTSAELLLKVVSSDTPVTNRVDIVPYSSGGWRYKEVAHDHLLDFYQGAEPSGFPEGTAAFGSLGCPLDYTIRTFWNVDTDILLRRTVTVAPGTTGLEVGVANDNDVQVWFNGMNISGGPRPNGGCAVRDWHIFPVPQEVVQSGPNVLAVRCADYGAVAYIDARLSGYSTNVGPHSDLRVIGAVVPPSAQSLQPLTIAWGTTNQGGVTAHGPWTDAIRLARETNGGIGDLLATFSYSNNLAAGQVFWRTQTVLVPAQLAGKYHVLIQSDWSSSVFETHEQNNILAVPIDIVGPDLVVTAVSAPASARSGDAIEVMWSVLNAGDEPTLTNWTYQIYLTQTPNSLHNPVILLSEVIELESIVLNPGASHTRTQLVTLPPFPVLDGSFFVTVVADAYEAQQETNELNNATSAEITLTLPPLPDLAIERIVAPASARPGETITVWWTVTNQGMATTSFPFWEFVGFGDASGNIGHHPVFIENLAPGGFLQRTQMLTVPPYFAAGEFRFHVALDIFNVIRETDENNNGMDSVEPTHVPISLALAVPSEVYEFSGVVLCHVWRNYNVDSPLIVELMSSNTNELRVPLSVTIPAGERAAPFDLAVFQDGLADGDQVVVISATAVGFLEADAEVTVPDTDTPQLTLQLSPGTVTEGAAVMATVSRNSPTNIPLIVTLHSSSPTRLMAPESVVIPAGLGSWSFALLAVDDSVIGPTMTYDITASAAGFVGESALLIVADDDTPRVEVILASQQVSEAGGPQATMATVVRTPVTDRALVVAFESSDPAAATVPSYVTIPPNEASADFFVAATEDVIFDGTQTAVITPFPIDAYGTRLAPGVAAALEVLDDDGPTLTIVIARKLLAEGTTTAISVSRNTPPIDDLLVTIVTSDRAEATVPASVVIPTGQASVSFDLSALDDNVSDGNKTARISALADGFTSGIETVIVTDVNLPDLVVQNISVPSGAFTEEYFTISYRVANQGLGLSTNPILQRILISRDPFAGDDSLLGQFTFTGVIPPGQYFENTLQLRLPRAPGAYWILVDADGANAVTEILEDNNLTASSSPIDVQAAYSAVVQTDVQIATLANPIPIQGTATRAGSGTPAQFELVNIHIDVRGFRRVISAVTDANGGFNTLFHPFSGEAGLYRIGATHPAIETSVVQDEFTILGAKMDPATLSLTIIEGGSVAAEVQLMNLGDTPLLNPTIAILETPANLSVNAFLPGGVLPPRTSVTLGCAVTALTATPAEGSFIIRVATAEGLSVDLPCSVAIEPRLPRLVTYPDHLLVGMVRERQKTVEFDVVNEGGEATGPIWLAFPNAEWMTLASTNPIPSLAPGQSNRVTLLLIPAADLPLGEYQGGIAIAAGNAHARIPFTFRAVGQAVGGLDVTAEDEYTYYAAGAPRVAGAVAQLLDAFNSELLQAVTTDSNGLAHFSGITEGTYLLRVTAPKHASRELTVRVEAGVTNSVRVLLPSQGVTYTWSSVPTDVPDRYNLVLETTFETVVPFPVVTATRPLMMPIVFPGEITQASITLTNHGLIAAKNVNIQAQSTTSYLIKPLVSEIGEIPARGSITVPVTVQIQPEFDAPIVAALYGQQRGISGFGMQAGEIEFGFLKECDPGKIDVVFDVVCFSARDGTIRNVVRIDLRPITLLREMDGCIEATMKAIAGSIIPVVGQVLIAGAACECASYALNAISQAMSKEYELHPALDCLCALASLNPLNAARKCVCILNAPEFDPPPPSKTDVIEPGGMKFVGPGWFGGGGLDCIPTIVPAGARPASVAEASPTAQSEICARVHLRLEQELVMTRSAFRATLTLTDNLDRPLSNVFFNVSVLGLDGQPANGRFAIQTPALDVLTGIDGTGTLPAGSTGTAEFTIVPATHAAPSNPTTYTVGGQLRYHDGENEVTIDLAAVPITVLPQPRLTVDYFHQRDVLADDPFTFETEPAEPYTLAVMLQNVGQGRARNVTITSGQPKIVENEKGLLIDFQILATQIFGTNGVNEVTPSLTADFGDLEPGTSKIGRWLFKSTLQGAFVDFKATVQHTDSLGNSSMSLIDSNAVRIHPLIRLVRDPRQTSDVLPDFLVNESNSIPYLPDALYLSEGAVAPLTVITSASGDGPGQGNMEVSITAQLPAGWSYLRVPDPGAGQFRLTGVRRSDGQQLPAENFWTTAKTFIGMGRRPIQENILHLLDVDSTGVYTLLYAPAIPSDSIAPASMVNPLPDHSSPDIAITWLAEDNLDGSGINFCDIYVSVNDAPFVLWLSQTRLTGAIYGGGIGSRYAFYSVATDYAGNREPFPSVPDAQTHVNLTNSPPAIDAVQDWVINEGDSVLVDMVVHDPDPGQSHTFELRAGPFGAVIDHQTGRLTWITSETHGPSTNLFVVAAQDTGNPAMETTVAFEVVVLELNQAPMLFPLNDTILGVDDLLLITNRAEDFDLPVQSLGYSLYRAPTGAVIDAATGVLRWRPSSEHASTSNEFVVRVTDDGSPPLSAEVSFTASIYDFMALQVGSAIVRAGQPGSVLVEQTSGAGAVDVFLTLEYPPERLGGLSVTNLGSNIRATVAPQIAHELTLNLATIDGTPLLGSVQLAELAFKTSSNQSSAFVDLPLKQVFARNTAGDLVPRLRAYNGRVVIVADQPLLEGTRTSNGQSALIVFGNPGSTYILEQTSGLDSGLWQESSPFVLTNMFHEFELINPTNRILFYRAKQKEHQQ